MEKGDTQHMFYNPFRWEWDKVKKGVGQWARNFKTGATIGSNGKIYKVMRTGALILLNPTESRRARLKKAVKVATDKRLLKQLFRRDVRIYDELERHLKAEARRARLARGRNTTHPKWRKEFKKVSPLSKLRKRATA